MPPKKPAPKKGRPPAKGAKKKRGAADVSEAPPAKRTKASSSQSKGAKQTTLGDSGSEWGAARSGPITRQARASQPDHDIFAEGDQILTTPTVRRPKGAAPTARPAATLRPAGRSRVAGKAVLASSRTSDVRSGSQREQPQVEEFDTSSDEDEYHESESEDEEDEGDEGDDSVPAPQGEDEESEESTEDDGTGLSKEAKERLYTEPDVAMPVDAAGDAKLRLKPRKKMNIYHHVSNPWILTVVRFLPFFPCFCVCMHVFMSFLAEQGQNQARRHALGR